MYIVFECRKCGHELYMDSYNLRDSNSWKAFHELSKRECPECGEEGYYNWILCGVSRETPDVLMREEED